MKVYRLNQPEFTKYGRIIEGYDFSSVIALMRKFPMPEEGISYIASDPDLEALPVFREFEKGFYGGLPAQLGCCMGHNSSLNGLEYHKGSEVNISVTDYIIMVGLQQDMEEGFRYDTSKAEAFYVPSGLAVEFYATTLHYCACHVQPGGYAHATFLPRGTNTPLDPGFTARTPEDALLQAKNKWLIAHPEGGLGASVPATIYGRNWTLDDLEKE